MRNSILIVIATLFLTLQSCAKERLRGGSNYISNATPLTPAFQDMQVGQTAWALVGQPTACDQSSYDEPVTLVGIVITGKTQNGYTFNHTGENKIMYISSQSNVLKSQISGYFLIDHYRAVLVY